MLVKTHNAVANVESFATINFDATLAAVYLVRNPLDVAVSFAHHSGQSYDRVIAFMAEPNAATDPTDRHVYEFLGPWSFHVASWMSVPHRPVLILRYEDMLAAPERAFGRLASFLRLRPSAAQLRAAIENSAFDRLARWEYDVGFVERPPRTKAFFRSGQAGQWKEALSPAQVAAIVSVHAPMMMRFGYVAENCGGV